LAKAYGTVQAVEDVTLSLAAGEFGGLVGANGAGKTTTMSCVGGLLSPDRGEIRICGINALANGPEARRAIGIAGQRVALYGGLSVETNLRFFARVAGGGAPVAQAAFDNLVGVLRLGPLLSRPVVALSVGQQRLVHVASALVHRPRVVLLDEPTAGLDVTAREGLLEWLHTFTDEGASVLLSTHHLSEVEAHCSTVSLLHRGRVVAAGTVSELIERHGAPRVEISIGGETIAHPGHDVMTAITAVKGNGPVDAVRVVRPSLEAVFAGLTEASIEAGGELGA
jgi:ABC-type multidrug transport system ATPase subunit